MSTGPGESSGGTTGTGTCDIACNTAQDCTSSCAAPAQAGYVWCCASTTCYTWSTACPATGSSSSGGARDAGVVRDAGRATDAAGGRGGNRG